MVINCRTCFTPWDREVTVLNLIHFFLIISTSPFSQLHLSHWLSHIHQPALVTYSDCSSWHYYSHLIQGRTRDSFSIEFWSSHFSVPSLFMGFPPHSKQSPMLGRICKVLHNTLPSPLKTPITACHCVWELCIMTFLVLLTPTCKGNASQVMK